MKSCLIVLSIHKNTDIFKSLDAIQFKKTLPSSISDDLKKCFFDKKDNIKMVSSERSGVGKSRKIKDDIELKCKEEENQFKYNYFPLGGVFTRDNIFNRLKNLNIKEGSSIHLDLNDTEDIDLMTDFLFNILILKSYRKNEDIFILPKYTKIIIEIPNSFINYESKFPILTLIPECCRETINDSLPLIVPENVNSNMQIVCNYLKLRKEKKLDTTDLKFQGITPDFFWCFVEPKTKGKKKKQK